MKKQHIPNYITSLRIIGAICMLFIEPFSTGFYIVYTVCGISDCFDGLLARKMKVVSNFGAKLDSVSDLLFYSVMLFEIIPLILERLPSGILYLLGVILLIRIASYITAAFKYHRFSSQHTYLNKVTGGLVFIIPYFATGNAIAVICFAACIVGGIASFDELMIHLLSDKYNPETKTVFNVIKSKNRRKETV